MATRDEILQASHERYSEYQHKWLELRREQGMGALVFMSDEVSVGEDAIEFEYWTFDELRGHFRRMQECDETINKWLAYAQREGGYPVMIMCRTPSLVSIRPSSSA